VGSSEAEGEFVFGGGGRGDRSLVGKSDVAYGRSRDGIAPAPRDSSPRRREALTDATDDWFTTQRTAQIVLHTYYLERYATLCENLEIASFDPEHGIAYLNLSLLYWQARDKPSMCDLLQCLRGHVNYFRDHRGHPSIDLCNVEC
jgi:hypothetical protein